MKVVFMGTAPFAIPSLKKLEEADDVEVALVVTQPDRKSGRGHKVRYTQFKEAALSGGHPLYQPEDIRSMEAVNMLRSLAPDLLVVVAYGQILSQEILDIPRLGAINLHGSLLPRYRGAAPIHWAVIHGERVSGVCTMYMAQALDAGDVIYCQEVPIGEEMTAGELYDELAETGSQLLRRTLQDVATGCAPRSIQDHGKATYAPQIRKEDQWIRWEDDSQTIGQFVRGMHPWPGAVTLFRGQPFGVIQVQYDPTENGEKARPGTILHASPRKGLVIRTGDGAISLLRVKPAGKKEMSAWDFVNGVKVTDGERLGEEE